MNDSPVLVRREVLVVLPTYNERENLETMVEQVLAQGESIAVLVVDDESPDGTGNIADALTGQFPDRVFVLHRKGPRGRGVAGVDGFRWACRQEVSYIFEMDADLSHPPEFLQQILNVGRHVDLAIGSRYIKGGKVIGWGMRRHIQSRIANTLTRLFLGLSVRDCTSGYRCFKREALNSVIWDEYLSEGPSIVEEILIRLLNKGCSWKEYPITFVERQRGVSKVSLPLIGRWLKTLWKVRKAQKRN